MVKVVIVEDQVLTEAFINKRIVEQHEYLSRAFNDKPFSPEYPGEPDINKEYRNYWESAKNRLNYFTELKNKLKII